MKLNLQYPPLPEYAAKHAAIVANAAMNVSNISLDYSPDSLKKVDRIVDGFRQEGLSVDQIADRE